ncbi:hypothetical protein OO013_13795 [Mangrovivirga sp. M17]|uniref:Secreted protein (Por secretion system target) n=1 Tax=Mangrovivirga halotolerans TaxID=2993936 RepID=A0ABT3RT46_9BACT|nr:hypothetical protein [Mangrovivirga halotolerans]MCX2744950.1 hypothetical protein [Mangrovivirga halotolerans]
MKKFLQLLVYFFSAIAVIMIFQFNSADEENKTTKIKSTSDLAEDSFTKWWQEKIRSKQNGAFKADKPDEFIKYYNAIRTKHGDSAPQYGVNYLIEENSKLPTDFSVRNAELNFDERGPSNVPGRTRGIVADPTDNTGNTWLAGSVGGGIWKTTDAGQTWVNKTPELPNIAISWLAYAPSNPSIIYAGTGEGFSASSGFIKGAGVFKSTDGGENWVQLSATANENFQTISRIIVDPQDPNTVLVCANNDPVNARAFNSGIFKSTDGGQSWRRVYDAQVSYVQDLDYEPGNFDVIYAAERRLGVLKSVDAGENWSVSNSGMSPSGRVEITVSPVKTDRVFASAQGDQSGNASDLYISDDRGETWDLLFESSSSDAITTNVDFLGGQGWYDNIIMAHPFDQDVVYVGGVNLWKFTVQEGLSETDPTLLNVEETGETFFELVQFGGEFLSGTIGQGSAAIEDYSSVEIRFGAGLSQKAYRFTVPEGEGPGVPASDYTYQDYVEVPFQVWDVDNNRQLMVSFRDQQRDGEFNLINLNTTAGEEDLHSREYLYIHSVEYSETPSTDIATDGGHVFNDMYFLWPYLIESQTWDPANMQSLVYKINWGTMITRVKDTKNVSDAYGQYSGNNRFSQTTGATTVTGLHPDHHNLVPVITDEANQEWKIINGNDGGVYVSKPGANPGESNGDWIYSGDGYNTTQFYFVDKAPGENRYIGGSQDNGTWLTPQGEVGGSDTKYQRALGGDGFGVVWHYTNPDLILGTVYYNDINKSTNGGVSFQSSVRGLTDNSAGNAPFITRLENSNSQPDVVYAVGSSGIWRSSTFGGTWDLIEPDGDWSLTSFSQVSISEATPTVVYAGAGMIPDQAGIFVSKDNGLTFSQVNNFTDLEMGVISGLATHPNDPAQAYALFSFAKSPKVLHTDDYGQTWNDISGFGANEVSSSGFPDVAVFDLQVMPFDNNIIWVGTEIGIIESTDGGQSWHRLNANMPAVSIWDIKVEDDQVVLGTHGRGIWSVTLPELPQTIVGPEVLSIEAALTKDIIAGFKFRNDFDSVGIILNDYDTIYSYDIKEGEYEVLIDINEEVVRAEINTVGYKNGLAFPGEGLSRTLGFYPDAINSYINRFKTNTFDFDFNNIGQNSSTIFDGRPIQTDHPYNTETESIVLFDFPVRVAEFDAFVAYKDIAIVEPGLEGSLPEEASFKDYVVVEASKNGFEWISITEKYDASFDSKWLEAYENNVEPKNDDFVSHQIDLLQFFEPGDEILLRFRMYSDLENTSWGWAIDDLIIQDRNELLSVGDNLTISASSIYPTRLRNGEVLNIDSDTKTDSYTITNLLGQQVQQGEVINNQITLQNVLVSGIYIVNTFDESGNNQISEKILVW